MIVKNEEKVISRCLNSVQDVVDEVIIVDTGSTDHTIEIALKNGAKVFPMEWENDFARHRNESINKATGRWILILDADEMFLPEDGKQLRQLVQENLDFEGFVLRVSNKFGYEGLGLKKAGSQVSSSLRVFKNLPAYRYEGKVHEQIMGPILNINPKASFLYTDIKIEHDGYLPDVVKEKRKSQRNMALLKKVLEDKPDDPFHRYNLGMEFIRIHQYKQAIREFRKAKQLVDVKTVSYGAILIKRELDCLQRLENYKEAIDICEKALEKFPDYTDLYFCNGLYHYYLQHWNEAESYFLKALEMGDAPVCYSTNEGVGTYQASFLLGKTYEQMNQDDKAIVNYIITLEIKPTSVQPFMRLISLIIRKYGKDELVNKIEGMFEKNGLTSNTWWSTALCLYQLGVFEAVVNVLENKPVPPQKEREKNWVLTRCHLLLMDADESEKRVERYEIDDIHKLKLSFYLSLKKDDAAGALSVLNKIEMKKEQELLLPLYKSLLSDEQSFQIQNQFVQEIPQTVWKELIFLYHLSQKDNLLELKKRINSYWRTLITFSKNPKSKVEGLYEWIKATNVRTYQLLTTAPECLEFQKPWRQVNANLLTLIDELFLGENV
jgi:glycosyltransferase involved in cell wall biosynthesis